MSSLLAQGHLVFGGQWDEAVGGPGLLAGTLGEERCVSAVAPGQKRSIEAGRFAGGGWEAAQAILGQKPPFAWELVLLCFCSVRCQVSAPGPG